MKIMIDPGHGPGSANRGPTGYYEHEGMWKLSCYLKATLERCGFAVLLTRTQGECPKLDDRGDAAEGCVLFLSEHSNACNGTVRGCEVYYSVRRPGDYNFAAALAEATAGVMGNNSRGAKVKLCTFDPTDDYFTVMSCASVTDCPHVLLCETGFHDNAEDEAVLKSDTKLLEIAEAQAKVICQYLNADYIEDKPAEPAHWYSVGDTVRFAGGAVYGSSTADKPAGGRGECETTVTIVAPGKPHPYHCIGGEVYGWVDAKSIGAVEPAESEIVIVPAPLAVSDIVRVRDGVTTFASGTGMASFVRTSLLYVRQIGDGKVLVSTKPDGPITGWVRTDDLVRA